jgi:hypothetical protein
MVVPSIPGVWHYQTGETFMFGEWKHVPEEKTDISFVGEHYWSEISALDAVIFACPPSANSSKPYLWQAQIDGLEDGSEFVAQGEYPAGSTEEGLAGAQKWAIPFLLARAQELLMKAQPQYEGERTANDGAN